jgi:putative endonuclease
MIRCADNSLYIGITTDLDRRFVEHQSQGKKCAKYLKGRAPLQLVFSCPAGTKSQATSLELRLKKKPKAFKEDLVTLLKLPPPDNGRTPIGPNGKFLAATHMLKIHPAIPVPTTGF